MSCEEKVICIDLTGAVLNIKVALNEPMQMSIRFPYSIVGYTFVAKVLNALMEELVEFTITADNPNNRIYLSLDAADTALLVENQQRWFLKQTSPASVESILTRGTVTAKQVTDAV